MLREQLKMIQEELNGGEDGASGEANYRDRIENSKMPEEVKRRHSQSLRNLKPEDRTTLKALSSGITWTSCLTSPPG